MLTLVLLCYSITVIIIIVFLGSFGTRVEECTKV